MIHANPRLIGVSLILSISFLFTGCSESSRSETSAELAELFYEHQMPGADPMPTDIFPNDETRSIIESKIVERQLASGIIVSRKRVGSNKMVSFGDQGRITKVTFVFEVECEDGMARETVVLQRNRASKDYKVVTYQIENIGKLKEAAPMSSTSA